MSEQDGSRVVEEFFAARNAKDWQHWAELHEDSAYHAGPDHAQPLRGRDALLAAHTGLGKVSPNFHYEITRILAHDDLVCAEWTLIGTHQGAIAGPGGKVEPTGKAVTGSRLLRAPRRWWQGSGIRRARRLSGHVCTDGRCAGHLERYRPKLGWRW